MADKRISQLIERTDIANNDVLPIVASGATTTNKVTISTIQDWMQDNLDVGVTSVGITLGTTGTDVSVSGSPITTSGNITINIPSASATARGLVTTGTQTFAGTKTFSSDLNINEVNVGRGGGNLTNNTRVGLAALNANTTGQQNTALGTQSLLLSTTGSFNTGLGYNALLTNTVGAANTAVGSQALVLNTTGTSNTSIGNGAGRNNTTGDNNSFLGSLSGADNTTGSSNVAVGLTALSRNITGGQNTAIGRDAGRWIADGVTNNTNTNSSIYIGFFSKANADNQSNQIVIGHNATGQGSNTVTIGNSDITSNKLFGRVIHADAVNADESATLGQVNTSLGGYVTLGTAQTITAQKTFTTSGSSDTMIISHGSGSGFALDVIKAGSGEAIRVTKTSGSGNAMTISGGNFEAPTIVKTGGTSSQFLKADGSVDSSTYLTTGTAASTYLPLSGGTLTGALNGTSASFSSGLIVSNTSDVYPEIKTSATDADAFLGFSNTGDGNNAWSIGRRNTGEFWISNYTGNFNSGTRTEPLKIASTGAATFSSSVNVGGTSANTDFRLYRTVDPSAHFFITAPGGDPLTSTFGISGTNIMSLRANGNVGIGTTSPQRRLDVFTTASSATEYQLSLRNGAGANNVSTGIAFGFNSQSFDPDYLSAISSIITNRTTRAADLTFLTAATGTLVERMRITSSGHLQLNTDSTGVSLLRTNSSNSVLVLAAHSSLADNTPRIEMLGTGYSSPSDTIFYRGATQIFTSSSASVERMRITSGGNVLVNTTGLPSTTTKGFGIGVDSLGTYIQNRVDTTANYGQFGFFNPNGAVGSITTSGSSTSYNTSSDYRLKENVKPVENALSKLNELKPCLFNFIADADEEVMGFIAHEVQEVIPQAVTGEKDGFRIEEVEVSPAELDEEGNIITEAVIEEKEIPIYQGIDHSKLVPLLVAAIKELKAEIDSLKTK